MNSCNHRRWRYPDLKCQSRWRAPDFDEQNQLWVLIASENAENPHEPKFSKANHLGWVFSYKAEALWRYPTKAINCMQHSDFSQSIKMWKWISGEQSQTSLALHGQVDSANTWCWFFSVSPLLFNPIADVHQSVSTTILNSVVERTLNELL